MPLPAEIQNDLSKIAAYFEAKSNLETIFIPHDVPWEVFRAVPNDGHEALADFLLCGAIQFGLTSNYDRLIEQAADNLNAPTQFWSSVNGQEAAIVRPHRALLKIHGCYQRNPIETVWCAGQLIRAPVQTNLNSAKAWLAGQLLGRDIVFIGFWSDWGYLNSIMENCLQGAAPTRVVLVDPSDEATLESKAPTLWAWSHQAGVVFHHVKTTGTDFLSELRHLLSVRFIQRVFSAATALYGQYAHSGFTFPAPAITSLPLDVLYDMRRSLTGAQRHEGVPTFEPSGEKRMSAVAHMLLLQAGAAPKGNYYVLSGQNIRVIQGFGPLSYARAQYNSEPPPPEPDDIVICAGATDDIALSDIVRGEQEPNFVRGAASGKWLTLEQAIAELGL